MRPDKNFKMKQSTKIMVATLCGSAESRSSFKHAMIDAQLCEEHARRTSLKSKDTGGVTRSRGAVAPE